MATNVLAPRSHWREIERGQEPALRVKLLDLTEEQAAGIPFGRHTPMKDAFAVIWPYVVEWNFRSVDMQSGQEMDVPPPAEYGPEMLTLIDIGAALQIVAWLKHPSTMQGVT
jgi:hypothetical protein